MLFISLFDIILWTVMWGISVGICEYTRHHTKFGGIFNKRFEVAHLLYFILGPVCAVAALVMASLSFMENNIGALSTKISKPFKLLTAEGRHQLKLEKKRRERELEEEERKRLEAQNETLNTLLLESDLEPEHRRSLATEINDKFDEKVQEEIDDVVGPLLDAKLNEAFEASGFAEHFESFQKLEPFIENLSKTHRQNLEDKIEELKEVGAQALEQIEKAEKIAQNQSQSQSHDPHHYRYDEMPKVADAAHPKSKTAFESLWGE